MIAEETTKKTDFNYVWQCKNDSARDGETIPMREGDYLFICIAPDNTVTFRYRKCDWRTNPKPCSVSTANSDYWAGAKGRFDPESGELKGEAEKGTRSFTMTIAPKKGSEGFTIRCEHVRNPPQGDWDGDDDWGGQQQG